MHKILSGTGILILSLVLLIFTSAHTVNFIVISIPGNNQIMAYAGLAAFDIGLMAWLYAALFNAISEAMRAIAWTMVIVNFLGVCALFAADTFLVAGSKGATGKLDQGTTDLILWMMVIVVCCNVLSTILYHAFDPRAKLRAQQAQAEAELEVQEHQIKVRMRLAELRHRGANAEIIGEETARIKSASWVEQQRRKAAEELPTLPDSKLPPEVREVRTNQPKLSSPAEIKAAITSSKEYARRQNKQLRRNEIARAKNAVLGRGYVPDHVAQANKEIKAGGVPPYAGSSSHKEQVENFFGKLRRKK